MNSVVASVLASGAEGGDSVVSPYIFGAVTFGIMVVLLIAVNLMNVDR